MHVIILNASAKGKNKVFNRERRGKNKMLNNNHKSPKYEWILKKQYRKNEDRLLLNT